MKGTGCFFLFLVFSFSPGLAQVEPPSSSGNAVVYFLRDKQKEVFGPALNAANGDPQVFVGDDPVSLPLSDIVGNAPGQGGYTSSNLKRFCLYDNDRVIGKLAITSYIRYECEAGRHLFWSRGEHNDYVEAELAPGKVYFIHVTGHLREQSPELKPIDPGNEFWVYGILNFISSQPEEEFSDTEIQHLQKRQRKKIEKELYRYHEDMEKGQLPGRLTWDMYYRPLRFPEN